MSAHAHSHITILLIHGPTQPSLPQCQLIPALYMWAGYRSARNRTLVHHRAETLRAEKIGALSDPETIHASGRLMTRASDARCTPNSQVLVPYVPLRQTPDRPTVCRCRMQRTLGCHSIVWRWLWAQLGNELRLLRDSFTGDGDGEGECGINTNRYNCRGAALPPGSTVVTQWHHIGLQWPLPRLLCVCIVCIFQFQFQYDACE